MHVDMKWIRILPAKDYTRSLLETKPVSPQEQHALRRPIFCVLNMCSLGKSDQHNFGNSAGPGEETICVPYVDALKIRLLKQEHPCY